MTAPALPTKAERAELQRWAEDIVRDEGHASVFVKRAVTALRLLDWADAQEAQLKPLSVDEYAALRGLANGLRARFAVDGGHPVAEIIDRLLDLLETGEGPALRALRRLVAVNERGSRVPDSDAEYAAYCAEHNAAWAEVEAVLAGGQPSPRVVVGYRVRWTDTRGREDQSTFRIDDGGNARRDAYECAYELLDIGRAKDVRIRKITRPVRDKSTGVG